MHFTISVRPEDAAAAHAEIAAARAARRKARPLVARLADAMRDMAGAGQAVDRHGLMLRGFLSTELTDAAILAARDRANAASVRSR